MTAGQGVIEKLWLHFLGSLLLSIFIYSIFSRCFSSMESVGLDRKKIKHLFCFRGVTDVDICFGQRLLLFDILWPGKSYKNQ